MDADRTRPVIGECISTPPGFDQPPMYEPLESAMALPEGRGPGTFADDMFSFGVTLLHILIGRRPGGQLRGRELLRARIANGSFAALTGDARRITSYNVCYTKLLRCVDPGIGFGKTLDHNLAILRRITSYNVCYTKLLRATR